MGSNRTHSPASLSLHTFQLTKSQNTGLALVSPMHVLVLGLHNEKDWPALHSFRS